MFKAGDKVKVLDDDQKGEVIRLEKGRVVIRTEFGFEDSFSPDELLPDEDLDIGDVPSVEKPKPVKPVKIEKTEEIREVDLHIGQLVDFDRNLSNYEMLQIQLNKVRAEMDLAYKEKRKKLIFIHGHGSGKLKAEVLKLLKQYSRIEVYDASYQKYRGGATQVKFN